MSVPNGTWFLKRWDPSTPRVLQALCVEFGRTIALPGGQMHTGGIYEEQGLGADLYSPPGVWPRAGGYAERLRWDPDTGQVLFQLVPFSGGTPEYIAGRVAYGVFTGRAAKRADCPWVPENYNYYDRHVTGWHADTMDAGSITPRVFDMRIRIDLTRDQPRRDRLPQNLALPRGNEIVQVAMATLRIDRGRDGNLFGRMKVYGWQKEPPVNNHLRAIFEGDRAFEEVEYDLTDIVWDGHNIAFTRRGVGWTERFTGKLLIPSFPPGSSTLEGIATNSFLTGRTVDGRYTRTYPASATTPALSVTAGWWANRAEVLTYGLVVKPAQAQSDWHTRTRGALRHLVMGGNPNAPALPQPTHTDVCVGPWGRSHLQPEGVARDDEAAVAAQTRNGVVGQYFAAEFNLIHQIPDPYAPGASMQRITHGYLAVPATPPPPSGYPICLALNGHGGSAYAMLRPGRSRTPDGIQNADGASDFEAIAFLPPSAPPPTCPPRPGPYLCTVPPGVGSPMAYDASSQYPYGDAFARAGYVVLAIDIGHRTDYPLDRYPGSPENMKQGTACYEDPNLDLTNYYQYLTNINAGDDRRNGNILRPSIKSTRLGAGWTTDWTEDGMRVWDVMQALTALVRGRFGLVPSEGPPAGLVPLAVNGSAVVVAGLSMGGEITTMFGALDPRAKVVVSAGYSPDVGLHADCPSTGHACEQWVYADNREYASTSDFHALIAPRTLVVEAGVQDAIYSASAFGGVAHFAHEKEVMRRSRLAYEQARNSIIHFLWDASPVPFSGHFMRFAAGTGLLERGVRTAKVIVPNLLSPYPDDPQAIWQSNSETILVPGWPTLLSGIQAVLSAA